MVSPHGGLGFVTLPYHDLRPFFYLTSSHLAESKVWIIFNDVIGFFANGQNCATVNGDPVSVKTINNGNPVQQSIVPSHPELYINIDLQDGGGSINTEMDGLTVVLTCVISVTRGGTNHIELAIADVINATHDSNVFLESGSLISDPPPPTPAPTPNPTPTTLNLFFLPLISNWGGLKTPSRSSSSEVSISRTAQLVKRLQRIPFACSPKGGAIRPLAPPGVAMAVTNQSTKWS